MSIGSIVSIISVIILIGIIIFGILYLVYNHYSEDPASNIPPLSQPPSSATLNFQVYSLLPCFINGTYQAQLLANGRLYKFNYGDDPISLNVKNGTPLRYEMIDLSSNSSVFTIKEAITSEEITNSKTIYLCDGNIVADYNLVNMQYSISSDWSQDPSLCQGLSISYSFELVPSNNCSDTPIYIQGVSCQDVNNSTGELQNFNSLPYWQGGWVGMNIEVFNGSTPLGSVTLTDATKPILLISPTSISFSSS